MRILVTGGAGFIGSNLVEALLKDERVSHVRVLDNLATGSMQNINEFLHHPKLEFIEGDIRSYQSCIEACSDFNLISHQAALGSVPRSIKDPLSSNDVNITGTLNIFNAARETKIKRIVFAGSSSTYGDHPGLPKKEDLIGKPISPYAVTKYVNELYATVFSNLYGLEIIGLRYFNIFGPKQNPEGQYAAVIPLFIKAILNNQPPIINGDGSHSRDFTYVDNAVQANILSLFIENKNAVNQIYNIACGNQVTLLQLFDMLANFAGSKLRPEHGPERKGDVKYSMADISKAKQLLQYDPLISAEQGLQKTFNWFKKQKEVKV